MIIRILLCCARSIDGVAPASQREAQGPPPLQTMPSVTYRYWLSLGRQTPPGFCTGIKGCAPSGDRNVA